MFVKKNKNTCRWRVKYENLAYDGGGCQSWIQYYWTKPGAFLSKWSHLIFRSWGGHAVIERVKEDGN